LKRLNTKVEELKKLDHEGGTAGGDESTNSLKLQLKDQIIRANDLEEQYVDAKMNWAELDLEVDKLKLKI
jgi:hypothetical protein